MKRLYSYTGLYGFVFGAPIFVIFIIVKLAYIFPVNQIWIASIPVVLITLYWVFTFRRWKKVYYEGGSLYIYNIFSKAPVIVHKDNIGGVTKFMFYDPRFYKVVFYDENKDTKYVYFQKNWFLSDFSDIIDKLND